MEERFFYFVGIVYFIFSLLALELAGKFSAALGIVLVVLLPIVTTLIPKNYKRLCKITLTTAVIAVNAFNARYFLDFLPTRTLANKTAELVGTVQEFNSSSNSICLLNATLKVEGMQPTRAKVLCYKRSDDKFEVGDKIEGQVQLFLPQSKHGIDFETINTAKGIFLSAKPIKGHRLKLHQSKNSFIKQLKLARDKIKNNITSMFFDNQKAVLNGILFGDKTSFTNELKTIFKRAGIYHTVVVSGLHMSIISQVIFFACLKLKFNKKLSAIAAILGCLCFAFMVGFTPSVIRSAIMMFIYFMSKILDKESDSLNSLGFSLLALLVINPYYVWDLGLQLSFLSTWGIIMFAPRLSELLKINNKLLSSLKDAFCVSLSATLVTFPLIAAKFSEVSVISPIANTFITPLIPIIFVLALMCGVLKPLLLGTFIYKLLIAFTSIIVTVLISVANVFSSFAPLKITNFSYAYLEILIFVVFIPIALITLLPTKTQTQNYSN